MIFLDKNDDFVYKYKKCIPLFCVIINLYCKSIHPVNFSTRYIFYSIYFIIKYNIELIFDNTSIIGSPKGSGELLSPLSVRRLSSVRPLTFHILINSSEATGPIWTKLWWNGPWMAPFQNCVRWSRLPRRNFYF
jgi:hypothetical protein